MEKYGAKEIMQYIIKDYEEVTMDLGYTAEQAVYRILEEYVRVIRNWEFQKATIYFSLVLLTYQSGEVPRFIYEQVIHLISQENVEIYIKDIDKDEINDFLNIVYKVKKIISKI